MPGKKTQREFLAEVKSIHGDSYDMSHAGYINSSTKVAVVCPNHGVFYKTPQKLIGSTQGCPECSGRIKWTWERFVEKATKIHSGRYAYPNQKFTTTKAKYTIICPAHGEFNQSIAGHLRGGCNKCAYKVRTFKQRDTQAEFIQKAVAAHSDLYHYTKVLYHNSQTKVEIKCPEHGVFRMKPNNHISGQGCPDCGLMKTIEGIKLPFAKALSRFRNVHGDLYEYDENSYLDYTTKMRVKCGEHGYFNITPHSHVSMQTGCRRCGIQRTAEKNRYSFEKILSQFHGVHGNQYEYDADSYAGVAEKIKIKCHKHGWFEQNVSTHKMGAGCAECSYELIGDRTRVTKEIFISQAIEEHDVKYDYSRVKWVDQYTEVLIGCDNEEHGYFLQVPRDHKRGSGCFRCNESRGERFIFNWLRDNDIEFIPQHTFPGLKDKALLRCDFYLPNENIVIEYNGLQHYDAVEVFGGESALKSTRRRDLIKQRFCEHNAIQFEVIRYDESPSVRLLEIILGK
jgi:hypothetical protein